MKHLLQFTELVITSFLFAFFVASLLEIWFADLWLVITVFSFIVWFLLGLRYFKLKNEMMKFRPKEIINL